MIPFLGEQASTLSIDDIGSLATKLGEELITLYDDFYEHSHSKQLRNLFKNLRATQLQTNKQLSVNIDRMMDI
jgi:hypothetical protein